MRLIEVTHHEVEQGKTVHQRMAEEEKIREKVDDDGTRWTTECVGNFESPKCAEVCPVDACVPDPGHTESKEQLLEKWHSLHPGETPAHEA
jgi:Fe-S-cluster-containing hydrogenase component 2